MAQASDALRYVITAGLLVLAVSSARRWTRFREPVDGALALAVGSLAGAALLNRIAWSLGDPSLVLRIAIVALLGSGLAMLGVRHILIPLSRWTWTVSVVAVLAITGAATWVAPDRAPQGATEQVLRLLLIGAWILCVSEPILRFLRVARRRPAVQRARLRWLSAGYGLLVLIAVLALPSQATGRVMIATQVLAIAALPLLAVGLAPPGWVRAIWRRGEEAALHRAMEELIVFSADLPTMAVRALEWATRLVGADGAFIVGPDRSVLASVGVDAGVVQALARRGSLGETTVVDDVGPSGGRAVLVALRAWSDHAVLGVIAGRLTPVFEAGEVRKLEQYGASIGSALDRVRLHRELRDRVSQDEQLLQAMSDLDVGMLLSDGERVLYANEAVGRVLGYSVEHLVSMPSALDLLTTAERPAVEDDFHRYRDGEEWRSRFETVLRHRSGRGVEVDVAAKALGTPEQPRFVAIVRDVTSRNHEAAELRRQKDFIERLIDGSVDGIFAFDRAYHVTLWSRGMEEITGMPAAEVIGRAAFETLPFLESTGEDANFDAALEGRAVTARDRPFSVPDRHRSGHFEARYAPLRGADGTIEGGLAVVRDITEQKVTRDREMRRMAQLEALTSSARRLTGALDPETLLPAIARSARETFRCDAAAVGSLDEHGAVTRLTVDGFTSPADDPCEALFGPGGPPMRSFLGVPIQRAGRLLGFLACMASTEEVFDGADEAVAESFAIYAAQAIDAAQAFQHERDLVRRLQTSDEIKDAFLTAISHELRTPLTVVLGVAQTLEREQLLEIGLSPKERRDLIHRLSAGATKLEHLLMDLLDVDRLSRGGLALRRRSTDLSALVRRVVEASGIEPDRTVKVRIEPLVAAVDPPMIERIVENLLVNAVRHTPSGTPIWVSLRQHEDGGLLLVEDAGPGVPDDMKLAVFGPFRQGPGTPKHAPGVGVGLTLVVRLAELHGGRAWVEDRPGGGASFRVFLPGAHVADELEISSPEPSVPAGPGHSP